MNKKLPHQISLEALLEALVNTEDTEELISYKNDVPMFLSKFKIEAGNHLVRPGLLYKLYKIYSEEPLTQRRFSDTAVEFIPKGSNYFKLNISPSKILAILNPKTNANYISSSSVKKHYESFIENAKVTKGTKWIEGFMFHEIYRFHCIDNNIHKRLRYEHFISISSMYFENRRIGSSKGKWYKLDPRILDILPLEHQQKVKNDRAMSEDHKLRRKREEKEREPKK